MPIRRQGPMVFTGLIWGATVKCQKVICDISPLSYCNNWHVTINSILKCKYRFVFNNVVILRTREVNFWSPEFNTWIIPTSRYLSAILTSGFPDNCKHTSDHPLQTHTQPLIKRDIPTDTYRYVNRIVCSIQKSYSTRQYMFLVFFWGLFPSFVSPTRPPATQKSYQACHFRAVLWLLC